jgi:chromate transporter
MTAKAHDQAALPSVGVFDLFWAFASISMMGFGGVLPWVRWMLVERRRWMREEEFVNALSLCQLLPGGNVMNIAVYVGSRFRGVAGGVAALSGLLLAPSLIVIGLGTLYGTYGHLPRVQGMLRGVAAGAAGLILAMGLRMAWRYRRDLRALPVLIATIVAMTWLKLPLLLILVTILPVSLIIVITARAQ